jgi:hypothetical protein
MKPYHADLTRPHGGYLVPASPCGAQRPNRTAAGMTAQLERKRRRHPMGASQPPIKLEGDVLRLTVKGTLDSLAYGNSQLTTAAVCPCCDHKTGKLKLRPGLPRYGRARVRRWFPRRPLP